MMYSGIDLHSNNSVVAIIDDADRVVAQKRLPNDITKITGFLARWQDEMAGVVVESTYNWYWLVDGLQDAGLHVHLANTAAIKQYEGLKHSGDETDARHLAHLLRLGILPTGRSCRGSTAPCAIWRASACSWCIAALRRSSRSRTSWRGSWAGG
jgi:transposase